MTSLPPDENDPKALLQRPFTVSYSIGDLTSEERSLLSRHGTWLNALAQGIISPTTPAQISFVQVARGERSASTPHERMWLKYYHARSNQTEHLRTVLYGGMLSFDQLEQIRINEADFTFSEQDHSELMRQLDVAKTLRASGGGAFVVYASTKGQD